MGAIKGVLKSRVGQLGGPGLLTIFVNVSLKVLLKTLPVALPKVDAPIGLKVTKNPVVIKVLVNTFNPHFRLAACAAVDTGLVLHRLKVVVCLTKLKVSSNMRFFRAIFQTRKLL